MGTLRLRSGATYDTGPQPVTKAADDAANAKMDAALIKGGAAVLKEAARREEVAKELDEAASRWEAKATDRRTSTHNDVSAYYVSKAASARARARELRGNK